MIVISAAGVGLAILLLVAGVITSNLLFVYISIGVSVAAALLLAGGVFMRRELFVVRPEVPKDSGASAAVPAEVTAAVRREPVTDAAVTDEPVTGRGAAGRGAAGQGAAGDAPAAGMTPPLPGARLPGAGRPGAGRPGAVGSEGVTGDVMDRAGPSAFDRPRPAAGFAAPDSEIVFVVSGRRRFHAAGCGLLVGRLSEELTIDEAVEEGFSACTMCMPGPASAAPGGGELAELMRVSDLQSAARGSAQSAAQPGPPPAGFRPAAPVSGEETRSGTGAPDTRAGPSGAPVARSGAAVPDADTELSEASPEPEPAEADAELPDAEGQLSEAGDPASTVWVVRGVSRYHLHECVLIQVVDDEDVDTMTLAEAAATGCTPCRACHSD